MTVHDDLRLPPPEQPEGEPARPIPTMTLRDYIAEAGRAVRQALPPEAWVEATVLDVRRAGKAYSVDLIEANAENPSTCAQMRCFLRDDTLARISEDLGSEFDPTLLKGVCAVLKIAPSFHQRYHIQGRIVGLNPHWVQGILERQTAAIREKLQVAGLYRKQDALPEPVDVTRLAVIHPAGSAGWSDVRSELERLESAGIAQTHWIPATFEGREARKSLCSALDAACRAAMEGGLDLILLVRGGGNAGGLAAVVSEDVARAICTSPVPVITGLGHASDRSLLDEVAWQSADTPSKALGLILTLLRRRAEKVMLDVGSIQTDVDRIVNRIARPSLEAALEMLRRNVDAVVAQEEHRLASAWQTIQARRAGFLAELDALQADLDRARGEIVLLTRELPDRQAHDLTSGYASLLEDIRSRLQRADDTEPQLQLMTTSAHQLVDRQTTMLAELRGEVGRSVVHRIDDAARDLDALHTEVRALSLDDTLKRGFAVAVDSAGRMIATAETARSSRFTLHFADGSISVRADSTS
ncbi:hypothetical protein MHY87_07015 [Microvirga sp. ACRRW]|uniref:exodeoxyribonuclease VII large subunit n=1 Tax=Microvirga sp. ACRRW TaxID=2918205 RepID=UPI001EF5C6F9|nr:exodeoxyribonuclease VII large subunit [Microvirga sp. ACRRW]MCG7392652.1 hypothetical protein [Microvirga sp. ACRRW]